MTMKEIEARDLRQGDRTQVFKAGSPQRLIAVATKALALPSEFIEIRWELPSGETFYEGLYKGTDTLLILE